MSCNVFLVVAAMIVSPLPAYCAVGLQEVCFLIAGDEQEARGNPVVIGIDHANKTIVELGVDSGDAKTVLRLNPSFDPDMVVLSRNKRWMCVRAPFLLEEGHPLSSSVLVVLERCESRWRTKWTTNADDWVGVPVFAGTDNYLVAALRSAHVSNYKNSTKSTATAVVFEVSTGTRIRTPIGPLHAGRADALGSVVDDNRLLLTRWTGAVSLIVEYRVSDWSPRVLCEGHAPVAVSDSTFVYSRNGTLVVSTYGRPDEHRELPVSGTPICAIPKTQTVLFEKWVRDPAYKNKDFPALWKIDIGSLEASEVLEHQKYSTNKFRGLNCCTLSD